VRAMRNAAVEFGPARESCLRPKAFGCCFTPTRRILRELDPNNPQLRSLSGPTWIPSEGDTARLHEEIARLRRERGLSDPEVQHTLPRQFTPEFKQFGIDIEKYRSYLSRDQHRLLPKGVPITGMRNESDFSRKILN
jgi:hypothetical protein